MIIKLLIAFLSFNLKNNRNKKLHRLLGSSGFSSFDLVVICRKKNKLFKKLWKLHKDGAFRMFSFKMT